MSFTEFEQSLSSDSGPPVGLSLPLRALWLEAKGDWHGAHSLAQKADEGGSGASEGRDGANAAYWYARAGRPVATGELKAEWTEIVRELLEKS